MDYLAYLHKDRNSDFGVSFPDFPGCITAGRTPEEAHRMAAESLALHIAGMSEDGETIPEPSTLDALAEDPAMKNAVAFLVHVKPEAERTARINITARAKQVELIDQMAGKAGMTRSAYMVQSALNRFLRQPRPAAATKLPKGKARHAARWAGRDLVVVNARSSPNPPPPNPQSTPGTSIPKTGHFHIPRPPPLTFFPQRSHNVTSPGTIGRRRASPSVEPNMDVPRKDAAKKRLIKRIIIGLVILILLVPVGYYVGVPFIFKGRLKPAAPGVELSTLWPDSVRRGPMVLEVRGLGTLVPEDTLLIPAQTDGRIEKILIKPGTPVKPDSIILVMSNQELQTALLDAEYTLKAAQASYTDLRVTLEKQGLDLKANAAQVSADYHTAQLKAERDDALVKEGLVAPVDAKISDVTAQELSTRNEIEEKRLSINQESVEAQLAAQKVKVDQFESQYKLKQQQVEELKVRAGAEGMLQALPELQKVEEGQKVLAGTALGKVAQPSHLKAELKIAETQAKDVTIGQPAVIDTRNGLVKGKVSRIDPAVLAGTVTVDCRLEGPLPAGARPDLSVDGTIELMRLDDVVYMGRPVFGQADSKVSLFKMEPEGKYANRVQVTLGRASVNTIEVKSGLNVGDRVILSDMSAWDAYERIKLN